jgi:Phosphotransferase enzyme family
MRRTGAIWHRWGLRGSVVGARPDHAARFLAAMANQALRQHLVGHQGLRWPWLVVGRHGLPEPLVARVIRLLPSQPVHELDGLMAAAVASWSQLAERSSRLPPEPPAMTALAVPRSAAVTVFLFGSDPRPLLVMKLPRPDDDRVDLEARALQLAEPAGIAPKALGRIGTARVQEGLAGSAPLVPRLKPARAGELLWPQVLDELARALARLASVTARRSPPGELGIPLEAALHGDGIDARSRRLLDAARRDVCRLPVSVLRHGDLSPQNLLVVGDQLQGVVDWEMARFDGAPGFDVWHAALAYLEQGLGLVRWSDDQLTQGFASAWASSPFWAQARRAARAAASAAGVPDDRLDSLEVAFFGRRLGRRLLSPSSYLTTPATAATMLRVVCAS